LQWFAIDTVRTGSHIRARAGRAHALSPAHHRTASSAALHCPHHWVACDIRQLAPLHPVDPISWEFSAATHAFDYKYIIRDADGVIRCGKRGNCRFLPIASDIVVYHDWLFQAETDPFMGAGISAALDMIYNNRSLCEFGEFPDLKILIDWAVQANLLLIQLGSCRTQTSAPDRRRRRPTGKCRCSHLI
jgi:hypothetical protein